MNQKKNENLAGETTHEGAPVRRITKEQTLRRTVMACMLWEKTFYEDGVSIADRIFDLASECSPEFVRQLAKEARTDYKLRHAPLMLLLALIKKGGVEAEEAIFETIGRPDEINELVALYWTREGAGKPLSAAMKRGLARAFNKFDGYALNKWDKPGVVKLRDVMFLVHPKPKDEEQAAVFKQLADQTFTPPDTWESRLTGGQDKKETFTDLLKRGRLGYMALLRNLRGMTDANVDEALIKQAIVARKGANVVLPFRFIAAAKYAPQFESELDTAMQEAMKEMEALPGKTAVLVDVSGSMSMALSGKSQMTYLDAAIGLSIMVSGVGGSLDVYAFGTQVKQVATRKGMAQADSIRSAKVGHGTNMGMAVKFAQSKGKYDRIIVISDMQSWDALPNPGKDTKGYMINVASYEHGVGYGPWTNIDGFSESTIRFIQEIEKGDG